jgi:hypothetical protein
MYTHHGTERPLNKLIKNMIAGMGSILVVAPVSRAEELNIDDYLHQSTSDAIHSDWVTVGRDLQDSAGKVATERVEQDS